MRLRRWPGARGSAPTPRARVSLGFGRWLALPCSGRLPTRRAPFDERILRSGSQALLASWRDSDAAASNLCVASTPRPGTMSHRIDACSTNPSASFIGAAEHPADGRSYDHSSSGKRQVGAQACVHRSSPIHSSKRALQRGARLRGEQFTPADHHVNKSGDAAVVQILQHLGTDEIQLDLSTPQRGDAVVLVVRAVVPVCTPTGSIRPS